MYLPGVKAYDSHMNLVLGDVVETIYLVDDDDDGEDIKVANASLPLIWRPETT